MVLELAMCTVDLAAHEIRRDGGVQPLTATEARLLAYLAARPGQVVTRRALLEDVFGYRPGLRSRTVDTTMHRLRDKLERDPAHPDHLRTVFGVGYRLDLPDREDNALVGRSGDLVRLRALLDERGMVTVVGPGGVGKTVLARRLAGPDDVVVELASTTDVDAVLRRLSHALGLEPVDGAEATVHAVRAALRPRRGVVVVLDNVEHLADALAAFLGDLHVAGSRWVVTSRRPVGYRDEALFSLEPLAPAAAARLFDLRATAAGLPPGTSPELVARLVEALDHLPHAIEMAAARTALLSPAEVLHRLSSRLTLLRGEHGTLGATIAWSVRQLSAPEQDALAQLSTFEGAFTLSDAEAVVRGELPAVDALETLRRWCLVAVTRGDPTRFALYESVRVYARGTLPDTDPAWVRHGAWALDVATPGTLHSGRSRLDDAWRPAVMRVLDDLVAAAVRATDPARAEALITTAAELLVRTGGIDSGFRLLDRLQDLAPEPSGAAVATRAMLRATGLHLRGETDAVHREVAAGLAAADVDTAPPILLGRLEVLAAAAAQRASRLDEAVAHYDRAADHATRADNASLVAMALANRASILHQLGRIEEGLAGTVEAASLAERAGDTVLLGSILVNQGGFEAELRRLDRALPTLRRALGLLGADVRSSPVMHVRLTLADLHREMGDAARCLEDSGPLLADLAAFGDRRLQALARMNLASALQELSLLDSAVDEAERAWALVDPADVFTVGGVRAQRGAVFHEVGWPERAEEEYRASIDALARLGETRQRSIAYGRLSALLADDGRVDEAAQWLERAEATGARGDPAAKVAVMLHAAHLRLAAGSVDEARRLLEHPPWAASIAEWSWDVRLAARLLQATVSSHRAR